MQVPFAFIRDIEFQKILFQKCLVKIRLYLTVGTNLPSKIASRFSERHSRDSSTSFYTPLFIYLCVYMSYLKLSILKPQIQNCKIHSV